MHSFFVTGYKCVFTHKRAHACVRAQISLELFGSRYFRLKKVCFWFCVLLTRNDKIKEGDHWYTPNPMYESGHDKILFIYIFVFFSFFVAEFMESVAFQMWLCLSCNQLSMNGVGHAICNTLGYILAHVVIIKGRFWWPRMWNFYARRGNFPDCYSFHNNSLLKHFSWISCSKLYV